MALGFTGGGARGVQWFGKQAKTFIGNVLDTQMRRAGDLMVIVAKDLVPKDTWATHDSIGYTYDQKSKTITLHADTPYALFLELGTYKMPARPFLRPAVLRAGSVWGRLGSVDLAFGAHDTSRGMSRRASTGHAAANARVNRKLHRGAVKKARFKLGPEGRH